MTPGRMFSQWLSIQFRLVCMMGNQLQDVTKFAYLTFGLVYTQACYNIVPLIIVFFSTADNVTITGSGGPLPQAPLMDTFDEYTQDSWTYDGRYSLTFFCFVLYFNVAIQHFTICHVGSILPALRNVLHEKSDIALLFPISP